MVGLIWAALQRNHPCTVDEAGEIIEAARVPSAKTALEQAILASMPAAPAAEKANPPKRGRPGTASGPLTPARTPRSPPTFSGARPPPHLRPLSPAIPQPRHRITAPTRPPPPRDTPSHSPS